MVKRVSKKLLSILQRVDVLFVVLSVPAIVILLGILPVSWGLDEQVHTARSYQVSDGNWYPDQLQGKGRFGGPIPVTLEAALSHGHATSNSVNREASFFDRKDDPNPALTAIIEGKTIQGALVEYDFGPTGPYSPIPYVPSAFGIGVGRVLDLSVGNSILLARALQAAIFVIITALALWLLRNSRVKWIVFVVALLPATIYQAVTINADAYTTAISLLFVAVIYRLFTRTQPMDRKWVALLAATSALLMFTKPSYALLLGLIVFLPKQLFASPKKSLIVKSAILAGSLLLLGLVSIKGLAYGDSILLYRDAVTAASISLTDQVIYILTHPIQFIAILFESIIRYAQDWGTSLIGNLGYNTIATPYPLMILAYVSMVFAGLYSKFISVKQAVWILIVTAVSALSVVVLLYATFNPVGAELIAGVQGRYFIPCIPLALIALGRLLPVRIDAKDRTLSIMHVLIAGVVLYGTIAAYVTAVL